MLGIMLPLGPVTVVSVKRNNFLGRTLLNPDHLDRAVPQAVMPVNLKRQIERSFLIASVQECKGSQGLHLLSYETSENMTLAFISLFLQALLIVF